MWDKVYAQVGEVTIETDGGPTLEVVSFRMVAEINGRAFMATHVVLKSHFDEMPSQYGHILDEMVEFIDNQAAS